MLLVNGQNWEREAGGLDKHEINVTFTEVACCPVVGRETVLIHNCVLNETCFQNKGRK